MLSRVGRQKNALFHLRRAQAHRALAGSSILRLQSSSSRSNPVATSQNMTLHNRPRRPSFQSQRNLATATDLSPVDHGSYISLNEPSPPVDRPSFRGQPFLGMASPFDSSSLVIVNETPQTQRKILRKIRGIGGDEDEMLANFHMSVKVGRFDRAAKLLNRFRASFELGSPEYRALHNTLLKGMVAYMIVNRQHKMAMPIQRWFEVDMPGGGVEPDATTYAAMIRMALRMFHGTKRDRTVRRYWQLAKQADLHEDLLAVEVLTDLDLGELSKVS